jgi:PAS domain S-box-containing protein
MKKEPDLRHLQLIFESAPLGIFTINATKEITSFNRAAEKITGHAREEALGRKCYEIFRANVCQEDCPLKRSMRDGETTREEEVTILTNKGDEVPLAISTSALLGPHGEVVGGVEMFRDLSLIVELRKRLSGAYVFEDIISRNASMRRVLETLPLLAQSQATVLIEGESGTGKELVARALHNLGPRRDGPFIAVNCGALPDTLLESELFGYVKGAFTDARTDKPGRFLLADKGTLFLDEIGELSAAMQVKLLRVLQERTVEPLGATRAVPVDVRVVAATNKDLAAETDAGRFRQDLFYRLNVVRVTVPSLEERRDDIPLLVDHFIRRFNLLQGRRIAGLTPRALGALLDAPYPGNVRELENAVEHGFVLCQGELIDIGHLPPKFHAYAPTLAQPSAGLTPLESAEARTISEALARNRGNRTRTARELGLSRNTLWRKMKRLGLLD